MPFRTELAAVKLDDTSPAVKLSVESGDDRDTKATSDVELARVGTFPDGGTVESFGNTR